MPVEITSKYTMCGDDLLLQAMDLPSTGLYFTDVDVSSNAIPINASHSWEVMDIIHEELKFEKLLSTSPNTFVLQTTFGTPPQNIPGAPTACSKLAESVRLRNHDCMWSGRCNSQESHAKSKLKSAAAAAAAAAAKMQATNGEVVTAVANKQTTSVPSPTKVRTIQAGESLLRFKQPMQKSHSNTSSNSSSGNSSSDENNNRPDTPQSLEGEDSSQDITCTTTGSNHLPLLSKDAAREHEVNKIKEYLADPAKQYKAYDNSTTLADVINTLESGDFKRDNQYPMSPSEDSDCRSSQMVDDDTESEREMDDEYYVQEDDEGISLKMMPTSHLNASRRELALSKMVARHTAVHDEDDEEEEDDDDEEEEDSDEDEETEEEEDESPVKGSKVFVGGNRSGNVVAYGDDEEDSGTERSLYGNSVTAQSKLAIQQQTSMHSDHCYTRCKARVDMKSLGVDTPSDSEEEIDVVGVGEKNLPTNPSAKDRKALQATVRNRFVRASAGGIVTAPPTGPNSGATTPGGRNPGYYAAMNNGSSYSSAAKMSQLKKRQQQQFSKMDDMYYDEDLTENSNISLSSSGRKLSGAAMRSNSKGSSRKRSAASAAMGYAKSSKHYHESSKKSKYAGSVNSSMKSSSARPMQKGYGSANDYRNTVMTSFTLEKRNLHNDLERQRRIGLKNLFEELKCQIPSLRDKERAPKVSILREAAQLCTDLSREQDTLFALRRQRERLLQTARTLKLQLQRSANRNK